MGQLDGLPALVEKHSTHGRGVEPSGVVKVQGGGCLFAAAKERSCKRGFFEG